MFEVYYVKTSANLFDLSIDGVKYRFDIREMFNKSQVEQIYKSIKNDSLLRYVSSLLFNLGVKFVIERSELYSSFLIKKLCEDGEFDTAGENEDNVFSPINFIYWIEENYILTPKNNVG